MSTLTLDQVRVIIVAWNAGRFLEPCVSSFLSEDLLPEQITIADNGTSDDSIERILALHPAIRVVRLAENRSYGGAINAAAKKADGGVLIIANPDTEVQVGCIARLLETLSEDDSIALVGPRVLDADGTEGTRLRRTSMWRALGLILGGDRWSGRFKRWYASRFDRTHPASVSFIEGSVMAVRRSAFELVGGFDEHFQFFYEDADLCVRLRKHGYRTVWEPRASVVHEGGHVLGRSGAQRNQRLIHSMLLFYRKHAYRRYVWFRGILRMVAWFFSVSRVNTGAMYWRPLADSLKRESYLPSEDDLGKQTERGLVSIVIPTCDRPECLNRLMKLLADQSYRKIEVIIVSQGVLPVPAVPDPFPFPVTVFHLGVSDRSIAKNVGARRAKGDIILFCDDDIVPPNELVEAHVQGHQDPTVGGVSCRTTEAGDPDKVERSILKITPYGRIFAGYHSRGGREVEMLGCGNMSIKAEAWTRSTQFDPALVGTSVLEEAEICEGMRRRGWKLKFSDAATVIHEPQTHGNRDIREKDPIGYFQATHTNLMYFFMKHRSRWCVPGVLIWATLRSIKQAIHHRVGILAVVKMMSGLWSGVMLYYGLIDQGLAIR